MSKKNRETDRAVRAAAALEEQRRLESRRRTFMFGGVALAVLAVVVVGFLLSRSLDTTDDVSAPAAGSRYGVTIGPPDAPHEVVIYEDFLCPYCGDLEEQTRSDLERLAEDGKVRVEYRPFNLLSSLGDYSARSAGAFAVVLDRSGADIAKEFHDLLFENQPSESGPFPDDGELVDLAVQAGAEEAEVSSAIEGDEGADWVGAATSAADEAGVSGTPTILLDGEVFQDGRSIGDIAANLIDRLQ